MSSSFDSVLLATACALYRASDRVVVQRWARAGEIAPFINYRLCGEHPDEFAIERPHVGEICLICHVASATVSCPSCDRPRPAPLLPGSECRFCGHVEPGEDQ